MHRFGVAGREHHIPRYNAVLFLLILANADEALDRDDFMKIMHGDGDGPIVWNDRVQDLYICQAVDRQGVIQPTKPMSWSIFEDAFRSLFMSEYIYVRGSMHMIRRELGKQLDSKCDCVLRPDNH